MTNIRIIPTQQRIGKELNIKIKDNPAEYRTNIIGRPETRNSSNLMANFFSGIFASPEGRTGGTQSFHQLRGLIDICEGWRALHPKLKYKVNPDFQLHYLGDALSTNNTRDQNTIVEFIDLVRNLWQSLGREPLSGFQKTRHETLEGLLFDMAGLDLEGQFDSPLLRAASVDTLWHEYHQLLRQNLQPILQTARGFSEFLAYVFSAAGVEGNRVVQGFHSAFAQDPTSNLFLPNGELALSQISKMTGIGLTTIQERMLEQTGVNLALRDCFPENNIFWEEDSFFNVPSSIMSMLKKNKERESTTLSLVPVKINDGALEGGEYSPQDNVSGAGITGPSIPKGSPDIEIEYTPGADSALQETLRALSRERIELPGPDETVCENPNKHQIVEKLKEYDKNKQYEQLWDYLIDCYEKGWTSLEEYKLFLDKNFYKSLETLFASRKFDELERVLDKSLKAKIINQYNCDSFKLNIWSHKIDEQGYELLSDYKKRNEVNKIMIGAFTHSINGEQILSHSVPPEQKLGRIYYMAAFNSSYLEPSIKKILNKEQFALLQVLKKPAVKAILINLHEHKLKRIPETEKAYKILQRESGLSSSQLNKYVSEELFQEALNDGDKIAQGISYPKEKHIIVCAFFINTLNKSNTQKKNELAKAYNNKTQEIEEILVSSASTLAEAIENTNNISLQQVTHDKIKKQINVLENRQMKVEEAIKPLIKNSLAALSEKKALYGLMLGNYGPEIEKDCNRAQQYGFENPEQLDYLLGLNAYYLDKPHDAIPLFSEAIEKEIKIDPSSSFMVQCLIQQAQAITRIFNTIGTNNSYQNKPLAKKLAKNWLVQIADQILKFKQKYNNEPIGLLDYHLGDLERLQGKQEEGIAKMKEAIRNTFTTKAQAQRDFSAAPALLIKSLELAKIQNSSGAKSDASEMYLTFLKSFFKTEQAAKKANSTPENSLEWLCDRNQWKELRDQVNPAIAFLETHSPESILELRSLGLID